MAVTENKPNSVRRSTASYPHPPGVADKLFARAGSRPSRCHGARPQVAFGHAEPVHPEGAVSEPRGELLPRRRRGRDRDPELAPEAGWTGLHWTRTSIKARTCRGRNSRSG